MQVHHRLAHVNADLPGGHRQRLAHQGQGFGRVRQLTGDQRHRRQAGLEQQRHHALRLQLPDAVQSGRCLYIRRAEINRVAGAQIGGAAHIQIGGQHLVQPQADRIPEACHHHRQGHGQTQRSHHAADRHGCRFTLVPGPRHRQQRQGLARHQWGDAVQQQADQPGQGGDAAHQQQGHRQIGRHRNPPNGWRPGQRGTDKDQKQTEPVAVRVGQRATQPLQGLRRWQGLRRLGRPPAARQRGGHTHGAVDQCGPDTELQPRRAAGKKAAAQVAAQQCQGQRRQGGAQGNAGGAAQQAQRQRFPQHQAQAFAAAQTQHAQQRKLLRTLGHAQ